MGSRRTVCRPQSADFRVAAHRPPDRRRRRSRSRARVSGHHGFGSPGRLGSTVSDRSQARPAGGRRVLEPSPRDAEGVHPDRARAGVVELAPWRTDRAANDSAARHALAEARAQYETALRSELDPLRSGFLFTTCGRRVSPLRPARPTSASTSRISAPSWSCPHCFWLGCSSSSASSSGCRKSACCRRSVLIPLRSAGCLSGEAADALGHRRCCRDSRRDRVRALIMLGLRTWWVDAVGTTALTLHVDPVSLIAGALAVVAIAVGIHLVVAALACARFDPSLLKGSHPGFTRLRTQHLRHGRSPLRVRRHRRRVCSLARRAGAVATRRRVLRGGRNVARRDAVVSPRVWLRAGTWGVLHGHGAWAVWRLGWRNTAYRPARSVLCIALIAFATFVIVAVEAFKRDDAEALAIAVPAAGDTRCWSSRCCRLFTISTTPPVVTRSTFRRQAPCRAFGSIVSACGPGDDTSCLNLYQPKNPRIMAATPDFINGGRFAFHSSLAETPDEKANPWLLLNRDFGRRSRSRHHRRELDGLRAAHEAGRRFRSARVDRSPDQPPARRGACRQHLSRRAADGRAAVHARCFPNGRAIGSFSSTRLSGKHRT